MKKRNNGNTIMNLIESIPFIVIFIAVSAGIYLSRHVDIKPQRAVSLSKHSTPTLFEHPGK
ncbi:hypothetical protein [Bdellovibrio svalbardensis]|uniref:Uncharacterized protein n=1 Tax=Bdellovibrio svalbardensis TaxID=2972972 RepID=A0ABT6DHH7_9BACT|nr:hypothetical protein [Bdellovibrio svalbardensis]MDG0816267.1 hypothetical protein [Bdellovibrio svalbardensis]